MSQKSDVVNQNVLTFVKAGLVTDVRDVEVYLNSKDGPSLNEEEKVCKSQLTMKCQRLPPLFSYFLCVVEHNETIWIQ